MFFAWISSDYVFLNKESVVPPLEQSRSKYLSYAEISALKNNLRYKLRMFLTNFLNHLPFYFQILKFPLAPILSKNIGEVNKNLTRSYGEEILRICAFFEDNR